MRDEAVMNALLQAMGDALAEEELGSGISFALLVDWCDGRPMSYVSNAPRGSAFSMMSEWTSKTRPAATHDGGVMGPPTPDLEAKCVKIGTEMTEEDVRVALFLLKWGRDGAVAWFSSMPDGRKIVEERLKSEGWGSALSKSMEWGSVVGNPRSKVQVGKLTIEGLDEVLESLPEEEREEARKEILAMFADPEARASARRVMELPAGSKDCPACGGDLAMHESMGHAVELPSGVMMHLATCKVCDAPYAVATGDA